MNQSWWHKRLEAYVYPYGVLVFLLTILLGTMWISHTRVHPRSLGTRDTARFAQRAATIDGARMSVYQGSGALDYVITADHIYWYPSASDPEHQAIQVIQPFLQHYPGKRAASWTLSSQQAVINWTPDRQIDQIIWQGAVQLERLAPTPGAIRGQQAYYWPATQKGKMVGDVIYQDPTTTITGKHADFDGKTGTIHIRENIRTEVHW